MFKLLSLTLLILISIQLNASQEDYSYKIVIKGKEVHSGFYTPRKVFHIKTPKYGGFVSGSIYIKPHQYMSKEQILKIVKTVVGDEINIEAIETPFQKFFKNDMLLSKNRLGMIYRIHSDYENSLKLAKLLNAHEDIEYCVPEAYYQLDETPNDPLLKDQTGLNQIMASAAWDKSKSSENIRIGIVDSGIDIDHNDLKSQILINTAEIPGNGIDDDGNGFIDDVFGWDFVGDISESEAKNHQWEANNNPKPTLSNNDHGTHVSGVAAATTDNEIGIASASWGAKIIAVKCATDNLSSQTGSRNIYRPYEGMLYAAMRGADIINCSWSSEYHDPLMNDVVNSLLEQNIVIVAAAGNFILNNDEFPFYPASLPGIISVGSITKGGSPSGFTHYGINVDIFAPGDGIMSTMPLNTYKTKSGTSMAAPFVSGIVALLKTVKPEISTHEIKHRIRAAANLFNPSLHLYERFFYGSLNAGKALTMNFPDGESSPGIAIEHILIENSDAITSYNPTNLKFTFRNFLSSTNDLDVKIIAKGNYVNQKEIEFTIDNFEGNSSFEKTLGFQLNQLNPWFSGNIDLIIEYRNDEGYFNIETVKMPIEIPTYNTYLVAETSPEYDAIVWNSASSAGRFDFWVGGYNYDMDGGMIYHWGRTLGFFQNDTVQSVQAFSVARAFGAVSGGNLKSRVVSTKDTGKTWQSEDISSFVKKIHGIIVYEDETTIAFGEKLKANQSFGIARKEAGKWAEIANTFTLQSGEALVRGAFASYGDKVMAGTSAGRIIYSDDRGKTWEISDVASDGLIKYITLVNQDSAVAFGPGAGTAANIGKVYNTVNGGQTWTENVFDFNTIERVPVFSYCPDSSKSVVVLHSNGEVTSSEDLGYTWRHELTLDYRFGKVNTGAGFTSGGKSRLWNQAYDIGFLEFDIIPINAKYSLSLASPDTLDFDTTAIQASKAAHIFLINDGNMRLEKMSQSLQYDGGTSADEIYLKVDFTTSFAPDKLESAEVRFEPKTSGEKSMKLTISTLAGDNTFYIRGNAYDPASVHSVDSDEDFTIKFDNNKMILTSGKIQFVSPKLEFFDMNGNSIEKASLHSNGSYIEHGIDHNLYSTGVYLLVITNNDKIYKRKIIIVR
ncbi:MAG: hypothetical protein CVV22_09180 [Ignavibacteriae bacterium HGW-Ignavibacteriae-1]|jgi:photosystem II stability/assembly factor-like uncharacterized protein|nr:MAG: hypothetical protein CVV22_09180 [Ignavibacteriae bacterium HGW-Ignavibacteriae-1]